jgi:hypothetical protein
VVRTGVDGLRDGFTLAIDGGTVKVDGTGSAFLKSVVTGIAPKNITHCGILSVRERLMEVVVLETILSLNGCATLETTVVVTVSVSWVHLFPSFLSQGMIVVNAQVTVTIVAG